MSISGKTISEPINITEPYAVLGVSAVNGVYDVAYICTSEKVNPESIFKPIKANTAYYSGIGSLPESAWDNPSTSGWEVVDNGKINNAIICRNMRLQAILATDWKRLGDFRNYRHDSPGLKIAFDTVQYSGYGQGSAFMGASDSSLSFTAKVTFPCIRPAAQPCAPGSSATVEVVRYSGSTRSVVWSLPKPSAGGSHTKEQWASDYGGKTLSVTLYETSDFPGVGKSKDYTFYLEVNGCHQRCGKECSATARAWRQWVRNPSDDSSALWQEVTPTVTNFYGDVFYSSVRRMEGKDTGTASDNGAYIRIKGLFCSGPTAGYADVYIGGARACRIANGTKAVTWENGAQAGALTPTASQHTHNINGTPTTVSCIDLDIRMDSKAWNSSVELRSDSRFAIID